MIRMILVLCAIFCISYAQKLRLQPELDAVEIETYLNNDRLFNIQVKCVLFDGPCDSVGRWLKPRIASALLGECAFCTPKQTKNVKTLLTYMQDKKPDLYRKAIVKYLENAGIQVPEAEKNKNPENVKTSKESPQDLEATPEETGDV